MVRITGDGMLMAVSSKVGESAIDRFTFIRVNEFSDSAANKFADEFQECTQQSQPIIPIEIESYGGSTYGLQAMVNRIRHWQANNPTVPVLTFCGGKAMSAGLILFGWGSPGWRFAAPNATFMLHPASIDYGHDKVPNIERQNAYHSRWSKRCFEELSLHLGRGRHHLADLIHQHHEGEFYFDGRQAKKLGFANRLGVPEIQLTTQMKVTA